MFNWSKKKDKTPFNEPVPAQPSDSEDDLPSDGGSSLGVPSDSDLGSETEGQLTDFTENSEYLSEDDTLGAPDDDSTVGSLPPPGDETEDEDEPDEDPDDEPPQPSPQSSSNKNNKSQGDYDEDFADMQLPSVTGSNRRGSSSTTSRRLSAIKSVDKNKLNLDGGLSMFGLSSKEKENDSSSGVGGRVTNASTRVPSLSGKMRSTSPHGNSTLGYKMLMGRYENDEFEPLGIKVIPDTYELSVYIAGIDEGKPTFATYELGESCMATDPTDPQKLYFRTIDALLTFKANQSVEIQNLVRDLPDGVLTYNTKYVTTDSLSNRREGVGQTHKKNLLGTSRDKEFQPPDAIPEATGLPGYNRLELLESHIRKPQLSVRRVRQICKWLNSLNVWKVPIDISTLHSSLCNGVCLSRLVQKLVPNTQFIQLNEKALSKRAALENLEKALGVIWRYKCVNNSRIPSALDIYNGNTYRIATMLQEVFEVYVQRPLMKQAVKVLKWYNNILRQYNRRLPIGVFTESDFQAVWAHFQSGTALFCVLYHLYGPVLVGTGAKVVKIDPVRIVNHPANLSEYRTNLVYVFSILRALEIDVIWDVMDWLSYPDADFVLLQLTIIYDALKTRQCSLAPAQGMNAGVTSGPQGLMVVGMIFSDTTVSTPEGEDGNRTASLKRNRAVLLGAGEDPLELLPIDSGGKEGRFFSPELPQGLTVSLTKANLQSIDIKSKRAASTRRDWLSTSDKSEDPLNPFSSKQVSILKQVNQEKIDDVDDGYTLQVNEEGVDEALKQLESMMKSHRLTLDSQEDALAERYVSLETRVAQSELTAEAYDKSFHELERARLALEDDRVKIEEIYQLRLESIHTQKDEAYARDQARLLKTQQQQQLQQDKSSPTKRSTNNNNGNTTTTTSTIKHKKLSSEQAVKLEESWVKFHARTKESKNSKIKKMNDLANSTHQSSSKKNVSNQSQQNKNFQNHEQVWQKFKVQLAKRTTAWSTARAERNTRLETLLSPSGRKESKIPTSNVPGSGRQIDIVRLERETELHYEEEIKRFTYEDSYRKRYLKLKYNNDSPDGKARISIVEDPEVLANREARRKEKINSEANTNTTAGGSGSNLTSSIKSTTSTSNSNVEEKTKPTRRSSAVSFTMDPLTIRRELDNLLRELKQPRSVKLVERSSRKDYMMYVDFSGVVTATTTNTTSPSKSTYHNTSYTLNWRSNDDEGNVSLKDLEDSYKNPKENKVVVFELGESPEVLVNSGGRTQIVVEFSTVDDADNYLQMCQKLKSIITHLSKL